MGLFFGVLMYQFAAAQQTSTAKLTVFFSKFLEKSAVAKG